MTKVEVNEVRRTIVFLDGQHLELSFVTAFDSSGTWLRIWADEGFFVLNTDLILYHQIRDVSKTGSTPTDD